MEYERLNAHRIDMSRFDPEALPQEITANIVIIDKSHRGIFPTAYQLKHDGEFDDEALVRLEPHQIHIDNDAFLMIGDVDLINKNQKMVLLRRGSLIHYKHLVIISHKNSTFFGSWERHEEFVAALQTLIGALRTRNSVMPDAMVQREGVDEFSGSKISGQASDSDASQLPSHSVEKIFYSQVAGDPSGAIATLQGPGGKRLYELHI